MEIDKVFGTICVLVFLSGSCSAGIHNHDKLLELLHKSKEMDIRDDDNRSEDYTTRSAYAKNQGKKLEAWK